MHRFFDWLFPPRDDERVVRELSLEDFVGLLSPQLVDSTRPATTALLPFSAKHVRPVLHEAKYHGNEKALRLLGSVLSEYLRDADISLEKTCIVPVPLGRKRHQERGFNQAEEIAEHAKELCGVLVEADLLTRARETPSQVSLKRAERELNLLGAFKATRRAKSHVTHIVFDDTITTGATLQAAIDALSEAGAEHILPIALAH